jgi:glycosyltransferase involved in cell wall biosynthesis
VEKAMKIMVFNVPAESGGALSVLNDFYNEYKADKTNSYIFVVSKPELKETENIKSLRYPWIKKSWFHRLFFDYFIAHKIVKEYLPDEVFSLQNIIVSRVKINQTVYVHNSLPFVEYKYSLFKNSLLWLYQNILSKKISWSIKKANKVIVQTEWIKKICVKKLKVDEKKIEVKPPKINIEVRGYFEPKRESFSTFFFPASGVDFKNHKIIVEACLLLKEAGIETYKVIFTLKGDENRKMKHLYKKVNEFNLPITFIGALSRDEVFEYYPKTVLVFPSYIESYGLPLEEAKMHRSPILASDCPFSHEILDNYKKVEYFNPFDEKELSLLLRRSLMQINIGEND